MNHIFRVIWSKTLGKLVVVSENTRTQGKSQRTRLKSPQPQKISLLTSLPGISAVAVAVGLMISGGAWAAAVLGSNTNTHSDTQAVAVGDGADAGTNRKPNSTSSQSVAVGVDTHAIGDQSTAIGSNAFAIGDSSVVMGGDDLDVVARRIYSGVIINGIVVPDATGAALFEQLTGTSGLITAGKYNQSSAGDASIAIGPQATAGAKNTSNNTLAEDPNFPRGVFDIAIGAQASSTGFSSIALGTGARALGDASFAMGAAASAEHNDALAIGSGAKALADSSFSFGHLAEAHALGTIAFGANDNAKAEKTIAFGYEAQANALNALAFGSNSEARFADSMAFGTGAIADGAKAIAIGPESYAKAAHDDTAIDFSTVGGKTGHIAGAIGGDAGVVSFGQDVVYQTDSAADDGILRDGNGIPIIATAGVQRQLQNVAPGRIGDTSTDAVNGSQLNITNMQVAQNTQDLQAALDDLHYLSINSTVGNTGGTDNYNNDGATGVDSVAIGPKASASGDQSTTIGMGSSANTSNTTAIGYQNSVGAVAADIDSTAIGSQNKVAGKESTAIGGKNTITNGSRSTAVGFQNKTTGAVASAFGSSNEAFGNNSLAMGDSSKTHAINSLAVGRNNLVGSEVGWSEAIPNSQADGSSAIGTDNKVYARQSTALGLTNVIGIADSNDSTSSADIDTGRESVAIGKENIILKEQDVAIGLRNRTNGAQNVALGTVGLVNGNGSMTIGDKATVGGWTPDASNARQNSSANAGEEANDAIAMGTQANVGASASDAIAVDHGSTASAQKATVLGSGAKVIAGASSAVALGSNSTANNADDVALGSGSNTTVAVGTAQATVGNLTYGSFKGTDPHSTVSVGAAGSERTITNVAAGRIGSDSTDAINGSQLYATQNVLGNLADSLATGVLGGDAAVDEDGNISMGNNIGGTGESTIDAAIGAVNDIANSPLTFAGDTGTPVVKNLGDTVGVVGGADPTKLTDNNIGVVADNTSGKLTVKLREDVDLGDTGSIKTGDTTVNNGGLTVADADGNKTTVGAGGTSVTDGDVTTTTGASGITIEDADGNKVALTDGGLNNGGNKIQNVAAGDLSGTSTDAVNGSQLNATNNIVQQQGNSLETVMGGNAAYNPATGGLTMSDIGGTGEDNVNDAIGAVKDTASKGWNVTTGKTGTGVANGTALTNVAPGDTATFTAGNNIITTQNGKEVQVAVNPVLTGLTSVTAGNTTLSTSGVTITNPADATKNVSLTGGGLNNGGNTITHVGAGVNDTDAVNKGQLDTLADNPLTFAGDTGSNVERKLGEQVNITGGATKAADLTEGNIGVVADGNDTLAVKLNKDISLGTDGSVTTGNTVVNNDGVTITGGANGPVKLADNGLDNGGNTITHVANGVNNTDAANVGQVRTARTEVVKGTNVANVGETTAADGHTVYTVNAKGTTASAGSTAVTVTPGQEDTSNVTDYAVDLSQASKNSLARADNSVQYDNPAHTSVTLGGAGADPVALHNVAEGVGGHDAVNVDQLDQVSDIANKGWDVQTNGKAGSAKTVAPGATVDFSSEHGNVVIGQDGTNLTVDLADNISLDDSGSVNIGDSKLNGDGLKVDDGAGNSTTVSLGGTEVTDGTTTTTTGADGVTITGGANGPVKLADNGLDNGGNTITHVAAGVNDADAVNKGQLDTLADISDSRKTTL